MSFDFEMKADASSALQASKQVESSLSSVEKKATEAGKALDGAFSATGLKDAAGRVSAMGLTAQGVRDKLMKWKDAAEALNVTTRSSAADIERFRTGTTALAASFSKVADAINAEKNMLDKIRGPARAHAEDVSLLTSMYNRGKVSAEEYLSTLKKLDSKHGVGGKEASGGGGGFGKSDAIDLARSQGGGAGGMIGDALENGAGSLMKGAGIAAIVGMAKQAAAAIVSLGDEYTELSNKAMKLAGSHQTVTQVLGENYRASVALHSSMREMIELSIAVKQGTDSLNMTSRQQADLTRAIGATVKLAGKDISEGNEVVQKLSYAFAQGTVAGGDFVEMVKKYPDIMMMMQKETGKSRQEIVAMANSGEISGEMMANAFSSAGNTLENKLGEQIETTGEKMQHLKDRAAVAWGGMAQVASQSLGKIIDAVSDLIDPFKNLREEQEAAAHAASFEAEINEKLAAGAEKLVRIKSMQAAMTARGVDTSGMKFDADAANSADRLRMVLAEIGVKMPQVFVEARAKASLYESKMQELTTARHGERQAEDIRKVWKELNGINDVLDEQAKKMREATDAVIEYRKAAGFIAEGRRMVAERGSLDTGSVGVRLPNAPGIPTFVDAVAGKETQEQRDADRGLRAKELELDVLRGKYSQTAADVITKQRAMADGVRDLKRNLAEGVITNKQYVLGLQALGVEFGFTYEFLKKLNEPNLTYKQTITAINYLMKVGAIDAQQYNEELQKIAEATPARSGKAPREPVGEWFVKGKSYGARGLDESMNGVPIPKYAGVSGFGTGAENGLQLPSQELTLGNEMATMKLNEAMERQRVITTELAGPMLTYKLAIKDIGELLAKNAITQSEATSRILNASEAYRSAIATQQQPLEVYKTSVTEINKLLAQNIITQAQATVQLRAARDTFRSASDATRKLTDSLSERSLTGFSRGLEQVAAQVNDIEGLIATKMMNAFNSLENATTDWIMGMDVSWKKVAQGIMRDITQIALRMLLIRAGTSLSQGPAAGLFESLGSGGGHATGGSYMVGGAGGPDSQRVMFRLTPGERVDFTPKGQAPSSGGGPIVINNNYNPNALLNVFRSRRGKREIMNVMVEHRNAIRGVLK